MPMMSVEPDSPYLASASFYAALLNQALFLEAVVTGRIAEPQPQPEDDTVDPQVTCPTCNGEGAVGIEYDPYTGLWDADTCPTCDGEGAVDLEVAFA